MLRKEFCKKLGLASIFGLINTDVSAFDGFLYMPNIQLVGLEKPFLCGSTYLLVPEAFEAFENMRKAAQKDGLILWGTSGYRSFQAQKSIWNQKFLKLKADFPTYKIEDIVNCIIEYTAVPGTSRHHWGTDIDIVDAYGYQHDQPLVEENYEPKGEYQYLNYWLCKYANDFGYAQVYTPAKERTGFKYEPWHYSYYPISKKILHQISDYSFENISALDTVLGYKALNKVFFETYIKDYMFGIDDKLI